MTDNSRPDATRKTHLEIPGFNPAMLTLQDLETLTGLMRKYQVPVLRITGGQRVLFPDLDQEQYQALRERLEIPEPANRPANRIHMVQACRGTRGCRYGMGDSVALKEKIQTLELDGPLPAKVKVGISGCRMCCCESWMRDVGLVREQKGWRLSFGGNSGGRPRIGDLVAEHLDEDQVLVLVTRLLNFYIRHAGPRVRTARFMERIGLEELRKNVLGRDWCEPEHHNLETR
ncbi:sulfite reductase, assimilatory-type [Desulfolithobacter dissulfuricans]|uniref:Sulfite reductase, assimilatory-type n=1 Tax=Desulfolithobacter dissulfuricans TaxID=2795293 RepID=A0A915XKK7_9BACT|nr:nitrite reductase [Desulfolithobacter dissulfuricans]BCO09373.1 sulfite reductase, assimilatory-type [Desulfolithobacter dissulfuricans]